MRLHKVQNASIFNRTAKTTIFRFNHLTTFSPNEKQNIQHVALPHPSRLLVFNMFENIIQPTAT